MKKTMINYVILLFMGGLWPFGLQAQTTMECKNIYTEECHNCQARRLMECDVRAVCDESTLFSERCPFLKGFIKDQAIVDLKIIFYVVDSKGSAVIKRAFFNNLPLSTEDTEEELAESVAQEILEKHPGAHILDGYWTYYINPENTNLYKTSSADTPVQYNSGPLPVPDTIPLIQGLYQVYPTYKKETEKGWRSELSVSKKPLQKSSHVPRAGTLSKLTPSGAQNPNNPAKGSTATDHPVEEEIADSIMEEDEIEIVAHRTERGLKKLDVAEDYNTLEYVKAHLTGDEGSACWPTSRDHIVVLYEAGSDQKICVMYGNCIHSDQVMRRGLTLVCRFDHERGACPTTTECLKDPYARVDREKLSIGPLVPAVDKVLLDPETIVK